MKIFDWVHRKFRQTYSQTPSKQHDAGENDRSSHASLVDLLAYDQFSRVKTSSLEDGSTLKVLLGKIKLGEGQRCKQGTMEHYFYNVEECGDRSVQAVLVKDIQHGLLAIGTFGISNIQPNLENIDVSECDDKQVSALLDHVPVDIDEFRKELEKVLYNRSSDENAYQKVNVECSKEEKDPESENKEKALTDKDSTERKVNTGRKVFPLRDFLEIPQTPAEGPVANKKKTKKLSSFNFFNGQKNINRYEKRVHDSQSPKELLPEIDGHKQSVASVVKRLMFKSRRATSSEPGELVLYRTVLEKFLQAFGKKGSTSVQSSINSCPHKLSKNEYMILRDANLQEGNGSDVARPLPKQDTISNAGNIATCFFNQLDMVDESEPFKFDEPPDEFNPQLCWVRKNDSSVLNDENGYWIKTDEEYVVLEL